LALLFLLSQGARFLLEEDLVRRFLVLSAIVLFAVFARVGNADTFTLTTGETVIGEILPTSGNDIGVQVKVGDGEYQRVPWVSFSQEDLKKFAQNPRLQAFVEPFIDVSQEDRLAKTEVTIKQPQRLERPARQSLFASLFSSTLGVMLMLMLYAANIYAGYEIALFRAQPPPLVCGAAAILPIIAPIVFLSLPTRLKASEEATAAPAQTQTTTPEGSVTDGEGINPMLDPSAAHPAGLKLHTEAQPAAAANAQLPPTTTFPRGQFTFNRRFFETRFPGFFGLVRRDADKDMVLVFKCGRHQHIAQRISRIATADLHIEVHHGPSKEEVQVNYQDITEIQLKHKDA